MKKYNNNYIGPLQYMVLVIFLSRSFLIGIGYSNILSISKYDSYISIVIGFIIGFIPILLLCHLNKKDINLFSLIKSKILKYIFIFIVIFLFIFLFKDLINFVNLKYLFNSSLLFISILFILPIIYIVNKGIESIGRSSLIMFYISILLFIITSISLIRFVNINNFKPFLKTDLKDMLYSSIKYISYTIPPIIFLNIIPKNNNIKYNKYLIIGYVLSFISSFIIIIFMSSYSYEFISKFDYPLYILIKKIEYDFVSSPENILSFFFIIDYFYSLIIYIYIIKYYLENELNLKKKLLNIIYFITLILLLYISIYKDIHIEILFVILLFSLILFLVYSIYKINNISKKNRV